MKNALLYASFVLFLNAYGFGQNNCVSTVLDSVTQKPIPFAIIQVGQEGFYTDSIGRFSLEKGVQNGTSIKISCLGYLPLSFIKNETCKDRFYLKPKIFELAEITILPNPPKKAILGILDNSYTSISVLGGEMIATYIPNESTSQKIIKKILFPYRNREEDTKKLTSCLRFHVFSVDSTKKPEIDLIDQNLLICPKRIKDKIEVDISKYKILIPPEGIYIGIEWVASDRTLVNENGYQITNDFGAFVSNRSVQTYPSYEKSIRNNEHWKKLERPQGVRISVHIGIEVEER